MQLSRHTPLILQLFVPMISARFSPIEASVFFV
jgi:hypothetical protein